ncbi:MAG: TRAP transporter large permease, partial [Treponemataceae bacterium]
MMAIMFLSLFALIIIGAPIAIALGGSSTIWVFLTQSVPDFTIIHRMVNGVDSFPLLAIPFFILAGNLMNAAGLTNQIFDFARAVVGWLPGGLGHVNIGASVIFAGMSGAAVADAGGLGTIEIKAMNDAGYDLDFSIAVTAASSTIGPIIPPSLPMVIYGVMASASIGKLFIAGFIPGLLMAVALSIMVAYYAKKRNYPKDAAFSVKRLGKTFIQGLPALMTPVIIIGGIMTGVFTPTEAAIAAVAYSLILGFVYRTMTFKKLIAISMETAETTAIILLIVAAASIFA